MSVYIYTGCDQVGKLYGISKDKAFSQYMLQKELASGFERLGTVQDPCECDNLIHALTKFTMSLYLTVDTDRKKFKESVDIGALRYHLFIKHQKETDKLPPTRAALTFHIQRADFITKMWKLSIRNFHPELSDPTDGHGWKLVDGQQCLLL